MEAHELQWEMAPRQGNFPDCWLLCVLEGTWRKNRTRLQKMITRLPCGRWEVRLSKGVVLHLWATFPPHSATPLWAALFEKAFSILRGSYSNMGPATLEAACQVLFGSDYRVYGSTGIPIAVVGEPGRLHSLAAVQVMDLHLL
jgi:hypothetical protein